VLNARIGKGVKHKRGGFAGDVMGTGGHNSIRTLNSTGILCREQLNPCCTYWLLATVDRCDVPQVRSIDRVLLGQLTLVLRLPVYVLDHG